MLALLFAAALAATPVPAETRQLVLATSPGWDATTATLRAYERRSADERWRAVGRAFPASLGRSGLAWGRGLQPTGLVGPQKSEGDGRSPAGVFELRLLIGYDPAPPPGTRLPYRVATPTLVCVDDPGSTHYNALVDEAQTAKDWSSAERMRRPDELYRLVVWVGHNDRPAGTAAGSCIFLHLRGGPQAVTSGCTAFERSEMQRLLGWLDPAARPVLVQLPAAEQRARAATWGLPAQGSTSGR